MIAPLTGKLLDGSTNGSQKSALTDPSRSRTSVEGGSVSEDSSARIKTFER